MKDACSGSAGTGIFTAFAVCMLKLLLAVSDKLCYNNMNYADNRVSLSFSLLTIIHL